MPILRRGIAELCERPGWANARDATGMYVELYAARSARLGMAEEAEQIVAGDKYIF